MTADDAPLDDRFLAEMAELDEALAAGLPDTSLIIDGDPALNARRERDRACLERLHLLRPGRKSASSLAGGNSGPPREELGRFRLVRQLGRGGFGVVFLAFDPTLDREVALKVPRPEALLTPDSRERFLREARAAATLDHPNLVTVFEAGEVGPIPYISSAYCPGPTLAQRLTPRGRPVPFTEAAALLAAIADGVAHAHANGVVHRDLKPSNVLLVPSDAAAAAADDAPLTAYTARVADFGLSKRGGEPGDATRSGAVIGTPSYMAPEQARGRSGECGPATDVYALGAIGYELLTGRPPFRGESDVDTLQLVCTEEPVAPQVLRPKVPRDLATICLKCLEKEPARRYATAAALAADLRRFLAGEPVSARPVSRAEHALRWCRKRPALTAALAGLVLVTLLGFSLVAWQWRATDAALKGGITASYFHRVNLAHHEWLSGNVGRADQLLGECPSDLRHWEWHYVRHLCDADLLSLEEHAAPVTGVAYSRCGNYLATVTGKWGSAEPGEVQVWSAATGERRWRSSGHQGPALCVAFSGDSRLLATGSANWQTFGGDVILWDVESGTERCRLPDVRTSVFTLGFSPDGTLLAVGQNNGVVRLWDVTAGKWTGSLSGAARNTIFTVVFTPDGRRLVVGGIDGAVVWDVPSRQVWQTLQGKKPHERVIDVRGAAVSPDGRLLVTGGFDQSVRLWDLDTGEDLDAYWDHKSPVISTAFSPDGRYVASGDYAGVLHVRSVADRRVNRVVRGHSDSVTGVAYSPDGTRILTGSGDRRARVWDVTTDQDGRVLSGDAGGAAALLFTRDGQRLIASGGRSSWGGDGRARVWDGLTAAAPRVLYAHGRACCAVACSPDEKMLATGGDDRAIKFWDLDSGTLLADIPAAHQGPVNRVTYNGDGTRLASAGGDGSAVIWNLARGFSRGPVFQHPHPVVNGAAFCADGSVLVTWGQRGMLFLWDTTTGARLGSLAGHEGAVLAVAVSPDGRTLASAGDDRVIRVWDLSRPTRAVLLHSLVGHTDSVLCLSFSRDGIRLASGSRDKTAKIWDVRSGHQALSLRGHPDWVNSVVFGPGDQCVVTSSEQLRIWDASPCTSEVKSARRRQAGATAAAWHLREAGQCFASDPPHWFGLLFHARHFPGAVHEP